MSTESRKAEHGSKGFYHSMEKVRKTNDKEVYQTPLWVTWGSPMELSLPLNLHFNMYF